MIIPAEVQSLTMERIRSLEATIADIEKSAQVYRDERNRLVSWLDSYTTPDVAPVVAVTVPRPKRRRPVKPCGLHGSGRPTRVRPDGTEVYCFVGNAYRSIAKVLSVGATDKDGVWLSMPEWERVRDAKTAQAAAAEVAKQRVRR